jgi:hypothetical protein
MSWRARDIVRCRSLYDVRDWWSCRWWNQGLNHDWHTTRNMSMEAPSLRCWLGIHAMVWDTEIGRSWSEPGEPGWACQDCLAEGFPVRIRFTIWFEEHLPARLVQAFFDWRYGKTDG